MTRAGVAVAWVWLSAAATGCGGRTIGVEGDGDRETGGTVAEGGSGNPGGAGGAESGGGSSAGGFVGAGGAISGTGGTFACSCPSIECATGENLVATGGGCCLVCEPCGPANCPFAPVCGPGQVSMTLLGECCPSACESSGDAGAGTDPGRASDGGALDCASGQAEYESQFTSVFWALSVCKDDADCLAAGAPGNPIVLDNPCSSPCGLAFSDSPVGEEIVAKLNSFGARECERCGLPEHRPCPPVRSAGRCVNGECQAVPL